MRDQSVQSWNMRRLSSELSGRLSLPRATSYQCVAALFSIMEKILREDGRITVQNFGIFTVRERKPRMVFKPELGRMIEEPPAKHVKFASHVRL